MAGPQTTVPLDDTSPRAVVQVHVIQELKKMGATYTCVLFNIHLHPWESQTEIQAWETGGKGWKSTHKRGLNSHGEVGFEGLCLLEWRGVDRLVFIVVLVILVLVVIIPHIRHWSLHTRPAVVRVVRAGGHGAVSAAITTRRGGVKFYHLLRVNPHYTNYCQSICSLWLHIIVFFLF